MGGTERAMATTRSERQLRAGPCDATGTVAGEYRLT